MDIVEIVTTIAHKISNCKHFFVSFRMSSRSNGAKRKTILYPFSSIFFDIHCAFFSFSFYLLFHFAPFTSNTNCADVDSFIYGYLLFALKQKPLHRYIAMPFDVSYAKRYAWQMASKDEIDERVKIKYTKAKRQQ